VWLLFSVALAYGVRRGKMTSSQKYETIEVKANLAIVLRGDIYALHEVGAVIEEFIKTHSDIQLVHKHISASKLWVQEGERNENDRMHDF
jgi:hypothetical protein